MPESFDPTNTNTATTDDVETITIGDKTYTKEALATKLAHADAHIQTLETENAEHLTNATSLMDKLDALEAKMNSASPTDGLSDLVETLKQQSSQPPKTPEADEIVSVSKEELVEAAKDSLKADQVEIQQQNNLMDAVEKARTAYGDDFGVKVDSMGKELGMSVDEVTTLAKNNPTAWGKLFLPTDSQNRTPDTTSSSITMPEVGTVEPKKGYLKMRSSKDQRSEFKRRMQEKLASL